MITRAVATKAKQLSDSFPILTVTGPRQSGKTTLIKALFGGYDYYSLENPDERALIRADPKGFLNNIRDGVVLDEVQRLPELFSYIQTFSDDNPTIKFILSGSQNFQLLESISQSLAGRTAILKLLPLSIAELNASQYDIPARKKQFYRAVTQGSLTVEFPLPTFIHTTFKRMWSGMSDK